ncbi:MAG TPA: hypothetical protein VLK84_30125 [Longimicrobium sp.]|nr:hypothetical protein [Longimicrobium sp.]
MPVAAEPRPRGVGRYPLAGTLGLASRHVPPVLVPPAARDRVLQVAGRIPAALTRAAYLECRLLAGPEPVDLIFRVEREGAEILAGRNPGVNPARLLARGPAWRAVADFCRAWLDGGDPAWSLVRHLWLELDLDDPGLPGAPPLPQPSVFIAFHDDATAAMGTEAVLDLVARVIHPLAPNAMDPDTRSRLRGVLDRRPPGAAVPYAGVMLSRPRQAVRVYLSRVPGAAVPGLLNEVGWPEDQGRMAAEVVAAMRDAGAPEVGMLHLDVLEGALLPRLGVEYTLERHAQIRGRVAEQAFLDALAARGLCEPERRDALLAWPGYELLTLRHELWPSLLARRVNCIKLVHEPDREPQMKAYLLAFHQPHLPRQDGAGTQ